jgi:esterase
LRIYENGADVNDRVLHHEKVNAEGTEPARWLYMLHGVYGAGRNWASLARRIAQDRPEWGVILVDLREHGRSQGFPPPHTLDAAAADIAALTTAAGAPASAVLGHSFGGKVALAYAQQQPPELSQVWIIDSTPAAKEPGGSAWRMLEIVKALPRRFDTRESLVAALEQDGVDRPVAQWMAMNLHRSDAGFSWRFDVAALEALLLDFFARDLFDVVETPPAGVSLQFVRASRSSVLSDSALKRVQAAADAQPAVELHEVDGGHWLNVDNPEAIIALVSEGLPGG